MQNLSFEVLLIEDDLGDVELTEAALAKSKLKINLNVVNDGEEAFYFLIKLKLKSYSAIQRL